MFATKPLKLAHLLLLAALLTGCSSTPNKQPRRASKPLPSPGNRLVVRVIDGDTVQLNGGERVRINNINTPEKKEEMGPEASAFARKLLHRKMVKVEGGSRDHYGRLLGDLVLGGKSFAEAIVAAGLAHVFLIPPYDADKARRLIKAQARARSKARGIWDTSRYLGQFHITSFHANAPGHDNFNLNKEYLRIASIATKPASIKGYTVTNRKGEEYLFGELTLQPGHSLILSSGHGTDKKDPRKQIVLFWNRSEGAWNNRGDTATLSDPDGKVVDQVIYKPRRRRK